MVFVVVALLRLFVSTMETVMLVLKRIILLVDADGGVG